MKPYHLLHIGLAVYCCAGMTANASAEDKIGSIVLVNNEGRPWPVFQRSDMIGEWTGIAPNEDLLVTLRIGKPRQRIVLLVTERIGWQIVTSVYYAKDVQVEKGKFSIGGTKEDFLLEGNAERVGAFPGSGKATLTLSRPGPKTRKIELYLFYFKDRSWIARTIDIHDRAQVK